MSSVAEARQAIYNRLASAPVFHPASADLFTDWTLQSGDVITVESDQQEYTLPIYGMQIKWNGSTKVAVASSGGKNRGSLEEMAQREANTRKNRYYGGIRQAKANEHWGNELYSEDGVLHSVIDQTSSYILTAVENVASDLHSFILQTPDMIHAEVGSAVSGFARSVIEQTSTYIRMEVSNAASAISQSVIEQTTEYVRTEVTAVASGVAWSVITQTMTNIEQQIARKSKIYVQWTDPNDGTNVLYEGDIWIKRQTNRTWNEANAAQELWNQEGVSWRSKYGDLQYVWRGGKWNLLKDTSADVENEVKLEQTNTSLTVLGRAVDTNNEKFNSKLEVTAREIRSETSTAKSQIYSVIAQTATNIRMVVANEVEGLQSSIEQTAESITTSVSAAKSTLYSVIQQTATGIYTNVTDYVSGNYSTILQTSTSIAMAVQSAKDNLQASIDIEKNRISLVVEGTGENAKIKPAEIVASINNGASNIIISADHINLNGYVKATDITANLISSKISLISTITAQAIEADSVKIRPVSGMGLVNVATAYNGSSLTQSGNTYTLRLAKMNGNYDEYSFSRAVSSWVWGGGNGKINVTALPQNQTKSVNVSIDGQQTITANGQYTYTVDYENSDGDDVSTGATKTVTVSIVSAADYYNSAYWKKPQDNNGVCTVPNIGVTAAETWFTMSSMRMTRAKTYRSASGQDSYYGKLYYWDDDDGSYVAASGTNQYWYYSSTNRSGTTTAYY